jgi:hypothetical protein
VLQSVHPDVRREVLTEAMAQTPTGGTTGTGGQPWAWGLLLDLLNDPDPSLRGRRSTSPPSGRRTPPRWRRRSPAGTPTSASGRSTSWSRSTRRPPRRCSPRRCPTPTARSG